MNDAKRRTYARLDDRAAAALLCGAVGLFLFNVVFGPIAIVLGATSMRRDTAAGPGRAAALLGIALGVADLLVFAVLLAGKVRGGTVSWIFSG